MGLMHFMESKQKEALTRKQQKNKTKQNLLVEESKPTELLWRPRDYIVKFSFPNPAPLNPPILRCHNITFKYTSSELIFSDLDFGIDMKSRVAIVGPNGVGKSTFLKRLTGELDPFVEHPDFYFEEDNLRNEDSCHKDTSLNGFDPTPKMGDSDIQRNCRNTLSEVIEADNNKWRVQIKADNNEKEKDLYEDIAKTGIVAGGLAGLTSGATAGLVLGPMAAAIGAVVGYVAGVVAGSITGPYGAKDGPAHAEKAFGPEAVPVVSLGAKVGAGAIAGGVAGAAASVGAGTAACVADAAGGTSVLLPAAITTAVSLVPVGAAVGAYVGAVLWWYSKSKTSPPSDNQSLQTLPTENHRYSKSNQSPLSDNQSL